MKGIKSYMGVCLLIWGCFMATAHAGSYACMGTRAPVPNVAVNMVFPSNLDFNHNMSSAQLSGLAAGSAHLAQGAVRGLTTTQFSFGLKMDFVVYSMPNGGVCLYPSRGEADIGYPRITVYVEDKYPEGSCQYNEILRHELTHVRNKREPLAQYEESLRGTFYQSLTSGIFPIYAGTTEDAKNIAFAMVEQTMKPIISSLQRDTAVLDGNLDSPASYHASQMACRSW